MKKGILLPIFSLPNKKQNGTFGKEAYEFIDILSNNKIDYWEILPINDYDISPYSPISYYALCDKYLDTKKLEELNLIETQNKDKDILLEEAYIKFKKNEKLHNSQEYKDFLIKKEIKDYAEYMHKKNNKDIEYYIFIQYILDIEWKELKEYANNKNVQIIGDMPIYPDYHSSEVKYNTKYYDLDENNKMKYVSGASPDYFNREGQKWGHPLYNFNKLKEEKYNYLLKRYQEYLNRFDLIRIDHFRAYDSFYKIPFDKTAKEGFYELGPSYDFFDELFKITNSNKFIVEDLGDLRKETFELKKHYNLKGMKIIQYTINPLEKKDEYENSSQMIIYTGNHDNNTIIGWYNELSEKNKENIKEFLEENNCLKATINESFIKYCLKTAIKYDNDSIIVIIPVQDIIGLDENSRINKPGQTLAENWKWQLNNYDKLIEKIAIFN